MSSPHRPLEAGVPNWECKGPGTRHPRSSGSSQALGVHPHEFLPSEISYTGPGYDVAPDQSGNSHQQDYAKFCELISAATDHTRPEKFKAALDIVRCNGYQLALSDVPDEPPGQRAAFADWVRLNVSRQTPGLREPGFFY